MLLSYSKNGLLTEQAAVTQEVRDQLVPKLEACGCEVSKEILGLKQYLVKNLNGSSFGGDG